MLKKKEGKLLKRNVIKLAGITVLILSLLAIPLGACTPEEEVEPIVLGLPTSLAYVWAEEAEMSAQLAVEEINAAGGVNVGGVMRPFKLVSTDTRDSDPGVPTTDSLLAIEKLILEEKPVALVVGPNRSEVMLSAMDIYSKYNIICIDCLAKSPALQAKIAEEPEKYKTWFRMTTTALYMGNYFIDLVKHVGDTFGFNKIFFIHSDVLWARGTVAFLTAGVEKLGWEVVGAEAIPQGTTDFAVPLTKVKDSGAQVLGVFFDMPEVASLYDQWTTMQVPALPLGVVVPLGDPKAWEAWGGTIEGAIYHICEPGAYPIPGIAKSKEFYDAYTARFGEPTSIGANGPSYDSVYVIKEAIEHTGSLDTDALVAYMEAIDMDGAIGRIRFDETHQQPYGTDPSEGAVGIMVQWQQPGVRKVVFPLPVAESEIVLPSWMQ